MLPTSDLLPEHLADRVLQSAGRPAGGHASGAYVMYWARTALRDHENPALDVAISMANTLAVPVFVYQALSERYPYASDRHHMFILEGARDFARQLRGRGIGTAFHLERAGHRGPHLRTLAQNARLVVTELMPVAPLRQWTSRLASEVETAVWEVDTACIVPVTLTDKGYDRAFAFRDATQGLRGERVTRPWPAVQMADALPSDYVPALPFEPVDLADANLADLIAQCRIDHTVGPVSDTRGGSAAGYARWRSFVDSGRIHQYHRQRNDPANGDGVSRMSAYLHYGMVSPLRVAREASALSGEGPAKFLDELLVWREVAYTFCHHRPDHDTVRALPAWARDTLAQHESDRRERLDWERLARARTGDDFWNAMQRSLRAHGELHNSVRMTWGKAIPRWTGNAADALVTLIDLNHRFALDGRDPASYGGILWCLGQFDRPFTPETPVLGSVRSRPSAGHAARVDVPTFTRHAGRPVLAGPLRVAVIGAGLSGLACARTLLDHHVSVRVFEKSRGVGGRCATRRHGEWHFDHGAQYFTVRDERLAPLVKSWEHQGLIAPWQGTIVTCEAGAWSPAPGDAQRWVAIPGMSALGKHLADGVDVACGTTVARLSRAGHQWQLHDAQNADLGLYDVVLTAMPAPQAHALLAPVLPDFADTVGAARMFATWATMLVFEEPVGLGWDAAFLRDNEVLSWACRNASKPARGDHETWVLHASRSWTAAHLEADADTVSAAMTDAFQRLGAPVEAPVHRVAHRWRYAEGNNGGTGPALYDAHEGLGAAGDWCAGSRVEGALLSGFALAGQVLTYAHVQSDHATAVPGLAVLPP